MNLALLKYVRSFSEGRIRIRHPALHRQSTADVVMQAARGVRGIERVESNTISGSLLILYDAKVLGMADLIRMGEEWAARLDA